jgi:hypothetical protein
VAVRAPIPSVSAVGPAEHDELAQRPSEGRAERWASWIVIYLAVLVSSLALGASAWAFGLAG